MPPENVPPRGRHAQQLRRGSAANLLTFRRDVEDLKLKTRPVGEECHLKLIALTFPDQVFEKKNVCASISNK
jgi:hypothetical protein